MKNKVSPRFYFYQLIFGWMNFVLAIPSIYLLLGLPLVMREHGWTGANIGFFQLAGLPALLKLLLALPVQRFRIGKSVYSHWVVLLVLPLVGLLCLMSTPTMLAHRIVLFMLTLAISLLSTWADIPLNALAVKLLPRSEQMRAGSIRAMALFLGAIVGSGFMLVLQGRWGWSAPFYVMSAGLLFGLVLLLFLQERNHAIGATAQPHVRSIMDLSGYFSQPGAKFWTCFLMTSFPFIGAAWLYLKPMLLDLGMDAQSVAWIVGVGGGIVGAISSLLGGRCVQRWGVAKAIPGYLLGALFTLVALTLCVSLQFNLMWVVICIFLVAIAMGAISSLVFGLMMFFTRYQHRASDYGLQASLFVITRLTFPIGAGLLLDTGGYFLMLAGLTCGVFAILIFVMLSHHHVRRMITYITTLSQEKA